MPLALSLFLLIEAVSLPLAVILSDRPNELGDLVETLRWVTVALFVGAGVVRLTRTHISADPRWTAAGIAYLIVALGYPLSRAVAPIHANDEAELLAPLMRMSCFAVAIAIFYATSDEQPSRLRPQRILAVSAATIGGCQIVLLATRALTQHPVDPPFEVYITMQAALGTGWLVVAARVHRLGHQDPDAESAFAAAPLVLLGLADLLRAFAAIDPLPWLLASGAVRLTAGAVALLTGTIWFQRTVSHEATRRSSAEQALAAADLLLGGEERQRSQQRHDAASVIYGIQLAWSALHNSEDKLPEETRERLSKQTLQELTRLHDLINDPVTNSVQPVRLSHALGPVMTAARVAGPPPEFSIDGSLVWANVEDLQAVMLTLIAGAVRPPGEHVGVRAVPRRGHVDLVLDTGAAWRRSDPAWGDCDGVHGVGYDTCQRLMGAMGGELSRDSSGAFVVTLATAPDPVEPGIGPGLTGGPY